MSKLEDAAYVTVEKRFLAKKPRTIYSLTATGRKVFEQYRDEVGTLLGA